MGKRKGLILGISGHARVGKDTFAEYLINIFSSEHNREFKVTAFAYRLKQMCLEHFNLSREQLWGDKKEEETFFIKENHVCWTSREIMQELGSFYRKIDYDFWVRKIDENWRYNNCPDLVITDVRHINECEYIKQKGILISISRDSKDKIHGMDHESETALDEFDQDYFDINIFNDGTLEDLKKIANNTAEVILKLEDIRGQRRMYDGGQKR